MTRSGADQWIIASAVTTGGVYGYMRWRGQGAAPVQVFVTAWGVVYVTLSIVALASPGLAAGFAILVLAADLLSNLQSVTAEIAKVEGTAPPATATRPPAAPAGGKTK